MGKDEQKDAIRLDPEWQKFILGETLEEYNARRNMRP